MDYLVNVAIMISIQAVAACGLNIIVGYAGQISLGHAAFYGIGAYATALLTTRVGMSFLQALPLVLVLSALIGGVMGLPSLRLRADFLAISTIGINFIVEAIFNYTPFFGAALGIGGIPRAFFFGIRLRNNGYLLLCLAFLAVTILICRRFSRSWAGIGCFAIRENEEAAASMGVSPVRAKLLAFVIGTVFAGLGGALYAHYVRFISPGDFGFTTSITMLSMIVLGGMGTLWGPVLGAVVLGVLPEVFRPLMNYRMLVYSVLLLLMIRFQPGGMLGEQSLLPRLCRRLRGDGS